MALTESQGFELGKPAPSFSLPGVDGNQWSLASFDDAEVLVVVFTCNHCPYAQACEQRLIAIQKEYAQRGVRLVAINPNDSKKYPDDSFENMKARSKQIGFNFPYLHDESQAVARAYNAVCTPDIFVFDRARKLVYNGRVDDNWKDAAAVTRQDLRRVIDATLAGRAVDFETVPSMGCSIKWKA